MIKNDKLENKDKQISIIIYYSYIYKIGGIESWIYNMCQRFGNFYNITVLFDDCDIQQFKRISNYVVIKKRNKNIEYNCDVLLIVSLINPYPINIKCKKCISMVHSDYEYYKGNIKDDSVYKDTDQIISVSNNAAKSLYSAIGKESKVIPNILGNKNKTNKILHLVSFTRLTAEKGYERMCILAKKLKDNNVKFDWKIFSDIDDKKIAKLDYPEIIFMQPTLDVYDYIVDADYLVQLSDTEAFCYSVHEALQYNTPVIVTNIPVFKELITDGYNGYLVELNMENINNNWINNIVNNIPKNFEYIEPCNINDWFEILGEPYESDVDLSYNNELVEIECINDYYDLLLQRYINIGETYKVNRIRAYELTTIHNNSNMILAKCV